MSLQTREVEVYDPSSYISIMKNQPVEWFDNTMSYGVFNWGLSSTGVRRRWREGGRKRGRERRMEGGKAKASAMKVFSCLAMSHM
jgi:hypothetical protein